ncbi:MAG: adenylyltransferase/cytidyltransferase family protein, partial [bacterium]|nr:adenylyltransferase/cytidyltransferase family protein [bacterium]
MKQRKVMVFGTFDVLHPGHLHFLAQARALGDFLVVSVSRDSNAAKFKKHKPVFTEKERLELIQNLHLVDKVVLGSGKNYLEHILTQKPDIIALGYDQTVYTRELSRDVKSGKIKAKVVRLKSYR